GRALIMRLMPLKEALTAYPLILTATVEKVDADKPAVYLKVGEALKGKAAFEKMAVLFKGDAESDRFGHVPQLLKRLAPDLPLVVSAENRGPNYVAFAYTSGTWFHRLGSTDGDAVRWRLGHGEPYLRRTFKGTTAEMKQAVVDGLAGKKEPPSPDEKEPPGFGPEVKPDAKPKEQGRSTGGGGPPFGVIP